MKKTQTSKSAQGMAVIRAVESEKPTGMRICYDPFARKFVEPWLFPIEKALNGYVERKSPGFIGFVVSRCRYIDDYLEKCLRSDTAQVVILGAGLDSRAYRFAILKGPVKVFEVDQPATQTAKINRVKKVFHEIPKHVTYVPIDFNDETLDKLFKYGFSRSLKTLFICEGVTPYLKAEAVDATLAWVQLCSASGSSIIFDYIHTSALSGVDVRAEVKLSRRTQWYSGEPLIFTMEKGEGMDFMAQRGFTLIVDACAEDFKRLYFGGLNQNRPVADIYSIVHGTVP